MVQLIFDRRAENQDPSCLTHLWTAVNQSPGKTDEIFSASLIICNEETTGTIDEMVGIILQNPQKRAKGLWVIKFPDFHGSHLWSTIRPLS
jgi:hypothetical protein